MEYAKRIAKPGDRNNTRDIIKIDDLDDQLIEDENEFKPNYKEEEYSYEYHSKPYRNNNYSEYKDRINMNRLEELQGKDSQYSSEIEKIKAMFN